MPFNQDHKTINIAKAFPAKLKCSNCPICPFLFYKMENFIDETLLSSTIRVQIVVLNEYSNQKYLL